MRTVPLYLLVAMLGKRITVWGMSCSGKTTLAAELARQCQVPHVEIDAIYWQPGWRKPPLDEFRAAITAARDACPDGWVIDGNYSEIQDLVLSRADTLVLLLIPLPVILWRFIRRTLGRIITGEILWGNNKETWKDAFFSRDSLCSYILSTCRTYEKTRRTLIATIPHTARVIELRSGKQVDEFIEKLRRPMWR